ncbi:hypothetical protein CF327_g7476, partial [Tilletia walkeri]
RLIDYGFHPPTCAWPISTGLLIEPSESESLAEIDRFCEAMLAIHAEADEVRSGKVPKDKNLLKRAPHTIETMTKSEGVGRPLLACAGGIPGQESPTEQVLACCCAIG